MLQTFHNITCRIFKTLIVTLILLSLIFTIYAAGYHHRDRLYIRSRQSNNYEEYSTAELTNIIDGKLEALEDLTHDLNLAQEILNQRMNISSPAEVQ